MLLICSFCSSLNLVIREAPPEPGLHCPAPWVESMELFEDVVGSSCKKKLYGVPSIEKVITTVLVLVKLIVFFPPGVNLAPEWFSMVDTSDTIPWVLGEGQNYDHVVCS